MKPKIIFIIGPGGVGKTTCGEIVAKKLDYQFIDLDLKFMQDVGHIGDLIRIKDYDYYCRENSKLFYGLLSKIKKNTVFVVSSGFLIYEVDNLGEEHLKSIKEKGWSFLLLPSENYNESLEIVLDRQLKRGFGLVKEREEIKFKERFFKYNKMGDFKIFSSKKSNVIAEAIVDIVRMNLLNKKSDYKRRETI